MVRILAYNSSDVLVAQSPYVSVVQGAPLTQQVTATAPAGRVDRLLRRDRGRRRRPGGQVPRHRRRLGHDARRAAAAGPHAEPGPDRRRRSHRHLGRRPRRHEPPQRIERRRLLLRHRPPHGDVGRLQPQPGPRHGQRARPSPSPPTRAPPTPTSTRRSRSRPRPAPEPARARARSPSWSASARTATAPCASTTSTPAARAAWSGGTATSRPRTPRSGSTG